MANDDIKLIITVDAEDLLTEKLRKLNAEAQKQGEGVGKALGQAAQGGEKFERAMSGVSGSLKQVGTASGPAFDPVVKGLEESAQAASGLSNLLGSLGSSALSSATALVGIGLGAAAISSVFSALESAADEAERLDRGLLGAAGRAKDYAATKLALQRGSHSLSNESGLPQQQVVAAASAARDAFPGPDEKVLRFLVGPELAAIADPLNRIDELTRKAIPLFRAFNLDMEDSERIFGKLSVAANRGHMQLAEVISTMTEAAPVANRMGTAFDDALAAVSAAGEAGADPEKARSGLQRLLVIIQDEGNKAHQRLAALGVDFDQSLGQIFDSINRVASENGGSKLFASLFPSAEEQKSINSILLASSRSITDTKVALVADAAKEMRAAAQKVGDEPGAQIARTGVQFQNALTEVGRGWDELRAFFAGTPLEFPIEVALPENVSALLKQVSEQVRDGNIEGARASFGELKALGEQAGKLYGDSSTEAVRKIQEQRAGAINSTLAKTREPGERVRFVSPEDIKVPQVPGLDQKAFASQAREAVVLAQSILDDANLQAHFGVAPSTALPAVLDKLQSDIERAFRGIDLAPLEFRSKVLPPDVAAAQKVLDDFEQGLKRPDGTKSSTDSADDKDKAKAREAVQTILAYYQSVVQLQRLSLGIDSQTAGALDKQHAQHQAVLQAVTDQLTELRLQPDQIEKIRAKLPALRAEFERLEGVGLQQAGLDISAKSLASREKSLTTARDLARAAGDVASADDLDRQIVASKAEAQRNAVEQQRIAAENQFQGDAATLASIGRIVDGQLEQIDNAEKLAGLTLTRASAERDLANSTRLSGVSDQLLQGLDRELASIRRNRLEREKTDRRDRITGSFQISDSDFDKVIAFYDQIAQRDTALAQRNAIVGQVDAISNALGGITDSYTAQIAAIELTRGAERLRLQEALRASAAEENTIRGTLLLFDQLTEAKREQAAISFAGQTAASIVEEKLLADAYTEATAAAKLFGETRAQALQREVDLVSQAKNSNAAYFLGIQAGAEDAVRSLNLLDAGVAGGHDLIIGFRDSVVDAFEGIGQSGHNFLQDFAVANLKNIQKQAATFTADTITLALFPPKPNEVKQSPLDKAAAKLFDSGDQMLRAALMWQDIAFKLSGGTLPLVPNSPLGPGGQGPTLNGPDFNLTPPGQDAAGQAAAAATGIEHAGAQVGQAGDAFSQAATAAGRTFGGTVIGAGNTFASTLGSFLGSLGQSAGAGLSNALSGLFSGGGGLDGILGDAGVGGLSDIVGTVGGSTGGVVYGFANGGIGRNGRKVTDPRDTIPAMLRKDEYVLTPEAVSALGGVGYLDDVSNGRTRPGGALQFRGAPAGYRNPGRDSAREGATAAPVTYAPNINLGGITMHVTGEAANDPELLARKVGEHVKRQVAAALESGSDRRLIEAVRGAGR